MIAVVNLEISNIRSVARALERMGLQHIVTADPAIVAAADVAVLPGVGAFADGMASLEAKGLVTVLRDRGARQAPVAGICLGMQLLADFSEEHGRHPGLGLVPGGVRRLPADAPGFRIPNVGWCDLHLVGDQPVFPLDLDGRAVYFTHSYHLVCEDPRDVTATIRYGADEVAVAVQRGATVGVQFHPEKSQDAGLTVLQSLLSGRWQEAA